MFQVRSKGVPKSLLCACSAMFQFCCNGARGVVRVVQKESPVMCICGRLQLACFVYGGRYHSALARGVRRAVVSPAPFPELRTLQ